MSHSRKQDPCRSAVREAQLFLYGRTFTNEQLEKISMSIPDVIGAAVGAHSDCPAISDQPVYGVHTHFIPIIVEQMHLAQADSHHFADLLSQLIAEHSDAPSREDLTCLPAALNTLERAVTELLTIHFEAMHDINRLRRDRISRHLPLQDLHLNTPADLTLCDGCRKIELVRRHLDQQLRRYVRLAQSSLASRSVVKKIQLIVQLCEGAGLYATAEPVSPLFSRYSVNRLLSAEE